MLANKHLLVITYLCICTVLSLAEWYSQTYPDDNSVVTIGVIIVYDGWQSPLDVNKNNLCFKQQTLLFDTWKISVSVVCKQVIVQVQGEAKDTSDN